MNFVLYSTLVKMYYFILLLLLLTIRFSFKSVWIGLVRSEAHSLHARQPNYISCVFFQRCFRKDRHLCVHFITSFIFPIASFFFLKRRMHASFTLLCRSPWAQSLWEQLISKVKEQAVGSFTRLKRWRQARGIKHI